MIILKEMQVLKSKLIVNKEFWGILIISIIALGLRLYRLGSCNFWYDEVYSALISKNFLYNWNPPVYFIILHYWIKLFGVSEFALRFPSLVFSVVSIPCLFFLGKKIFNRRVGLYASLVMCLSSFHLWYAQEARPYSLSALLSILSTYFLYRFLTEGKTKLGFIYILFFILGLYSDITYYYLFLLSTQLLAAVIFIRKNIYLKLFLFSCLIFLVFFLRLEHFISKFLYVKAGFWVPAPSLKSLIFTIENFNLGYNVSIWVYWFLDLIILIILTLGFLSLRQKKVEKRNFIFVAILFLLPFALVFWFSKIFFPVYLDRGFIIFSPYYYLLLGLGIDYLGNKRLKEIILSVFLVILLISLASYYRNLMPAGNSHHIGVCLKKPYKPALRFIEDNFKSGDIIMHTNSSSQKVFEFYSRNKEIAQNFLFAPKMIDSNWNRPYVSGPGMVSVEEIAAINAKRIWVVSCDWERGKELDENSKAVNSEMSKMYKLDLSLEFDGLWVYRYLKL
ncbi:MAG: glycosyltransferase family 39 protein [Candidatus Omnitrophota bacterium]